MILGVNGIHLKGWEGNDVLELISILLKDSNTTELRLTLKDLEIAERYSKIIEEEKEEAIEIMSPSKINNNVDTQEIEAIDVSPTKSEPTISNNEPTLMDYEDNFEALQQITLKLCNRMMRKKMFSRSSITTPLPLVQK